SLISVIDNWLYLTSKSGGLNARSDHRYRRIDWPDPFVGHFQARGAETAGERAYFAGGGHPDSGLGGHEADLGDRTGRKRGAGGRSGLRDRRRNGLREL